MVKNLPPHAGGTGSISSWESKIPRAFVAEKPRLKKKAHIKKIFQKKGKYDKYEKSVVFPVILPHVVANKTFSLATNPNGTI